MPTSPLARHLIPGLAALAAAAAPLLAQADALERVEIRGRVVEATPRHNVRAACQNIDRQLQRTLARTLDEEHLYGEVKVKMVILNGDIATVEARGLSYETARDVRKAVRRLDCAPGDSGAQLYRFSVEFVDPDRPASDSATRTAADDSLRISG